MCQFVVGDQIGKCELPNRARFPPTVRPIVADIRLPTLEESWFEIARLGSAYEGADCTCPIFAVREDLTNFVTTKAKFICLTRRNNINGLKTLEYTLRALNQDATILKLEGPGPNKELALLDIDQVNFSWFVMGDYCRRAYWIFSLSPTMDSSVLDPILNRLQAEGFPITGLIRRPANCPAVLPLSMAVGPGFSVPNASDTAAIETRIAGRSEEVVALRTTQAQVEADRLQAFNTYLEQQAAARATAAANNRTFVPSVFTGVRPATYPDTTDIVSNGTDIVIQNRANVTQDQRNDNISTFPTTTNITINGTNGTLTTFTNGSNQTNVTNANGTFIQIFNNATPSRLVYTQTIFTFANNSTVANQSCLFDTSSENNTTLSCAISLRNGSTIVEQFNVNYTTNTTGDTVLADKVSNLTTRVGNVSTRIVTAYFNNDTFERVIESFPNGNNRTVISTLTGTFDVNETLTVESNITYYTANKTLVTRSNVTFGETITTVFQTNVNTTNITGNYSANEPNNASNITITRALVEKEFRFEQVVSTTTTANVTTVSATVFTTTNKDIFHPYANNSTSVFLPDDFVDVVETFKNVTTLNVELPSPNTTVLTIPTLFSVPSTFTAAYVEGNASLAIITTNETLFLNLSVYKNISYKAYSLVYKTFPSATVAAFNALPANVGNPRADDIFDYRLKVGSNTVNRTYYNNTAVGDTNLTANDTDVITVFTGAGTQGTQKAYLNFPANVSNNITLFVYTDRTNADNIIYTETCATLGATCDTFDNSSNALRTGKRPSGTPVSDAQFSAYVKAETPGYIDLPVFSETTDLAVFQTALDTLAIPLDDNETGTVDIDEPTFLKVYEYTT